MFLPHNCNIRTTTDTITDGSCVRSEVQSYTNEPCISWMSKGMNNRDMKIGQKVDVGRYEVVCRNLEVKIGDIVEIKPSSTTSLGKFIVDTVDHNYSIVSLGIDNVHFTVSKTND